jgi:polyadenylate-binding protein
VEDKEKKEDKPAADASADDDENKLESLGFGFVNFVNHDSAEDAVREMNEKSYTVTENGVTFDKVIYVGRAQKKAERERELRAKYETEKLDRIAKFQGTNLYVKNLDDAVTDDVLREEFGAFGTITSAHVMKEPKTGASRGFGFVCFSTPEDSTRAVNEMNGKIISGKPIFVALAQRREVRRAQLEAQHGQGRGGVVGGVGIAGGVGVGGGLGQPGMMRGMPLGGPMVGGYGPGAVPMYMPRVGPGGPGGPGGMHPSYPVGAMPQMMGGRGGYGMQVPGGQPGVRPGGGYPMQGYGMMPAQPGRGGPQGMGGPQIAGGRGGGRGPGGPAMGRGGAGGPPGPYGRGGRGPMPGQPPIKFNQQARNAVPGGMMVPSGPQPIMPDAQQPGGGPPPPSSSNEQLTPAALASATPEVQKNMIGERLYPLIHQTQPELAGKITGMLLEMDNSELLHLLESPEALNAKIQEALQVLEAHKAAEDK